ncbi:MAG TPA: peptidylprolyl isomerase, partial [Chitinophagaceae bacterium]|nr:peptidylprolyl isomerase [Chitinophagaceae bacterium]
DALKKEIGRKADSLYKLVQAGVDFGKLATQFSNDYVTAISGGTMHDISVGEYDPAFENMVWSLPKDGAVSKPFVTEYGYHIVKRLSITPVVTDPKNKTNLQEIKERAMNDSRWLESREVIFRHVIKSAGFKKYSYEDAALWALTDSMLDHNPLGIGSKMGKTAPLFQIGDTIISVPAWINYVQTYRFKPDGSAMKPHEQIMNECIHDVAMQYYRDHLENFNEDFRDQMNDFREGNLFFEIMQRDVWNKSQADSAGLMALYEKNQAKYLWKQSADAVVFFCSDQGVGSLAFDAVKKDPVKWQKDIEPFAEKVIADSARYEWEQIPNSPKTVLKPHLLTNPLINKTDNTVSFAYILKVYPKPMPRTFAEAKGLVINDYQEQLENNWVNELKKKYPVVINQKALNSILK